MINVDKIPAFPKTSKYLGTNTWPAHRIYLKKLDQRTMRITAFDCRGTDFGSKYTYNFHKVF